MKGRQAAERRPAAYRRLLEAGRLAKASGLHRLHQERPGTAVAWLAEP